MIKKKRRRRRKRNIGKYESSKAGTCTFRSSWEKVYFEYLDTNPNILSYLSESLKIPYVSNIKTGRLRNYIPDLLVTYIDGRKELIEIKPKSKLTHPKNMKKFAAARSWCLLNDCNFILLTEMDLKSLGLL